MNSIKKSYVIMLGVLQALMDFNEYFYINIEFCSLHMHITNINLFSHSLH